MRRRATALLAVAIVATTAGCGFIFGGDALKASASPATVPESVQNRTGYVQENVSTLTLEYTPSIAGQKRTIKATNYVARYERRVAIGTGETASAAVFATFATPAVEVAGQTFNPTAEIPPRALVRHASTGYSGVDVGQRVRSRNVSMLGASARVDTYAGTARIAGSSVQVFVHVTEAIRHGSDFVVAFAVHPRSVSETAAVDRLIGNVTHGG